MNDQQNDFLDIYPINVTSKPHKRTPDLYVPDTKTENNKVFFNQQSQTQEGRLKVLLKW